MHEPSKNKFQELVSPDVEIVNAHCESFLHTITPSKVPYNEKPEINIGKW